MKKRYAGTTYIHTFTFEQQLLKSNFSKTLGPEKSYISINPKNCPGKYIIGKSDEGSDARTMIAFVQDEIDVLRNKVKRFSGERC